MVRAVGTGPGDAGSQKIAEKLQAQKNNAAWDVDVAVIHQKMAGDLVREGLLAPMFATSRPASWSPRKRPRTRSAPTSRAT